LDDEELSRLIKASEDGDDEDAENGDDGDDIEEAPAPKAGKKPQSKGKPALAIAPSKKRPAPKPAKKLLPAPKKKSMFRSWWPTLSLPHTNLIFILSFFLCRGSRGSGIRGGAAEIDPLSSLIVLSMFTNVFAAITLTPCLFPLDPVSLSHTHTNTFSSPPPPVPRQLCTRLNLEDFSFWLVLLLPLPPPFFLSFPFSIGRISPGCADTALYQLPRTGYLRISHSGCRLLTRLDPLLFLLGSREPRCLREEYTW